MRKLLKPLAFIAGAVGAATLAGRLAGYKFGRNMVVRCQKGHLYTTIWIPGVKLKGLEFGFARYQRCPVGNHWGLALPVKEDQLSEEERQEAASHKDIRVP